MEYNNAKFGLKLIYILKFFDVLANLNAIFTSGSLLKAIKQRKTSINELDNEDLDLTTSKEGADSLIVYIMKVSLCDDKLSTIELF